MTSISETFRHLNENHEGALIAYLPVGYPNLQKTARLADALVGGGVDVIELGIPFSDPIADGPVIQEAVSRSLATGTKPLDALSLAKRIRGKYEIPVVLMTYYNPVLRYGLTKFLGLAKSSGVSGIVVPDLPVEESVDYKKICLAEGIDTIFLASPSTEPNRLKQIVSQTSGYLYLVSLYGVTGVRSAVSESTLDLVRRFKEAVGELIPLAAGFGISRPEHVKSVIKAGADGAIVGSAFVETVAKNSQNFSLAAKKLKSMAKAMKKATLIG